MRMFSINEPRSRRKHTERVVYDGRERLGSIKQIDDELIARDRRGQIIGRFGTAIDATIAIGKAAS